MVPNRARHHISRMEDLVSFASFPLQNIIVKYFNKIYLKAEIDENEESRKTSVE